MNIFTFLKQSKLCFQKIPTLVLLMVMEYLFLKVKQKQQKFDKKWRKHQFSLHFWSLGLNFAMICLVHKFELKYVKKSTKQELNHHKICATITRTTSLNSKKILNLYSYLTTQLVPKIHFSVSFHIVPSVCICSSVLEPRRLRIGRLFIDDDDDD